MTIKCQSPLHPSLRCGQKGQTPGWFGQKLEGVPLGPTDMCLSSRGSGRTREGRVQWLQLDREPVPSARSCRGAGTSSSRLHGLLDTEGQARHGSPSSTAAKSHVWTLTTSLGVLTWPKLNRLLGRRMVSWYKWMFAR